MAQIDDLILKCHFFGLVVAKGEKRVEGCEKSEGGQKVQTSKCKINVMRI